MNFKKIKQIFFLISFLLLNQTNYKLSQSENVEFKFKRTLDYYINLI
jgi:hypothetical protein